MEVEIGEDSTSFLYSAEMKERYEELREGAVNGGRNSDKWGLALFIHRGMMAWMKAWSSCRPQNESLDREPSYNCGDIYQDIHGNIVLILANMVLSSRMERQL
jgi:hypothetical protein